MSFAAVSRVLTLVLMPVLVACTAQPAPSDTAPAGTAAREDGLLSLAVETETGRHDYLVEVARTPAEQARGLMFRQELGADRGMIFPYDPPAPQGFWMKNTYVPLDIIFIAEGGRIESVAANTVPLSTSTYESKGPVVAVLELNAGEAARIGAGPGDRVIYELPNAP
ncbi:MAG: DUF192 domain-containing protein [Pseudomonadota bacterium]